MTEFEDRKPFWRLGDEDAEWSLSHLADGKDHNNEFLRLDYEDHEDGHHDYFDLSLDQEVELLKRLTEHVQHVALTRLGLQQALHSGAAVAANRASLTVQQVLGAMRDSQEPGLEVRDVDGDSFTIAPHNREDKDSRWVLDGQVNDGEGMVKVYISDEDMLRIAEWAGQQTKGMKLDPPPTPDEMGKLIAVGLERGKATMPAVPKGITKEAALAELEDPLVDGNPFEPAPQDVPSKRGEWWDE